MRRPRAIHAVFFLSALAIAAVHPRPAIAVPDEPSIDAAASRRERTNPILRPASDSPTARVMQLAFGGTATAPRLYSAGEDKVVRVWSLVRDASGAVHPVAGQHLLWPIYRDRVGAILAMSVFRRQGREYVAIGGIGVKTSQVNVIDVEAPERTTVLLHPEPSERRNQAVFSLDYDENAGVLAVGYDSEPDLGQPNAKVLLWQLADEPKLLRTLTTGLARARYLRFSPDGKRLAVAGNASSGAGGLIECFDDAGERLEGVELACDDPSVLSADYVVKGLTWLDNRRWQAATIAGDVAAESQVDATLRPGFRHWSGAATKHAFARSDDCCKELRVRLTGSGEPRVISLAPGGEATAAEGILEVNVAGTWVKFPPGRRYQTCTWTLAVAEAAFAGRQAPRTIRGVRDVFSGASRVLLTAKDQSVPPVTLEKNQWAGWITAAAYAPRAMYAAAASDEAAGPEIRIWDTATGKLVATLPTNEERSHGGMPINFVRIGSSRAKPSETVVLFGAGPFDATGAAGAPAFQFQLDYPRLLQPFEVRKTISSSAWRRVAARDVAAMLPREAAARIPLCGLIFTLARNSYIAIGYPAGIEIRALASTEDGVAAGAVVRKFYGHSSRVTSLDASPSGDWLLSGSTDGTICAWSLKGLPAANELGVTFREQGGAVAVAEVAAFSPGWEAGFSPGQTIVALQRAGVAVPRPQWLAALSNPTPGVQLYVEATRGRQRSAMISPVAHDPLWTFYPQRDGNWILWTPQGYFDSSPDAASRFEWHVNLGNEATGARTFLAQDFRDQFRKRPVIDALVRTRDIARSLAEAPNRIAPAPVSITIAGLADGALAASAASVAVSARSDDATRPVGELEIWLNGQRLEVVRSGGKPAAAPLAATVEISPAMLRPGANMLAAVAVTGNENNRLNTRRIVRFNSPDERTAPPRLHYLGVGVTKLDNEAALRRLLDIGELKYAARDAVALKDALVRRLGAANATGAMTAGKIVALAEGGSAPPTRASVISNLEAIAAEARPEDFVIVMLAGHGFDEAPDPAGGDPIAGFFFVAKDTTPNLRETALGADEIGDLLARLPCASLLLVDACHSGAVRPQDEQLLDLGGLQLGPQVLTACGRLETSKEHDSLKHGLFTYAALEALGAARAPQAVMRQVDDGRAGLSVDEFCRYVKLRTPHLLAELVAGQARGDAMRHTQNPEILSSLTFEAARVTLAP